MLSQFLAGLRKEEASGCKELQSKPLICLSFCPAEVHLSILLMECSIPEAIQDISPGREIWLPGSIKMCFV